jgi:hypothetical protein
LPKSIKIDFSGFHGSCWSVDNKMFRRSGGALEHLITTFFGNAQEENHVIDKHSLQQKFKQNATAVVT